MPQPDVMLATANARLRDQPRQRLRLSENMFALMIVVLSDLPEQQRERSMGVIFMKCFTLQTLTYELVRTTCIDLFCAPSSPLEKPTYSQGG